MYKVKIKKNIDWKLTFKLFYLKIRREFLITFRPRYVIKQLMLRKGECIHSCCKDISEKTFFSCKYLNVVDGKCEVYHTEKFPINCFVCPVDKKDTYYDGCIFKWYDN